jgi:hypothetical protein
LPYLTSTEEKELKRLRTMTDERIFGDEELWTAKGTISFSIGHWGGEGVVGFGFKFGDFLRNSSP